MAVKKVSGKRAKFAGVSDLFIRASSGNIDDYKIWLECLYEGIWVLDTQGLITYANPRAAEMLGYTVEEVTGKSVFTFVDERNRGLLLEHGKRRRKGIKERHELELLHRNGGIIFTSIESDPIYNGKDEYCGVVAAVQDITWQKSIEEHLRESDARYQAVYNNELDYIFIHDLNGNLLDANNAFIKVFGINRDDIPKINIRELLAEDERQQTARRIEWIVQHGQTDHVEELKAHNRNGEVLLFETTAFLLKRDQKPYAIMGILRDITKRKKAEEALKSSEERYRLLVENSGQGIMVVQNTLIKYVNAKWAEIAHIPVDKQLNTPFTNFLHPKDKDLVLGNYRRRVKGEEVLPKYVFRIISGLGEIRWIQVNAVLLQWEGNPATLNFLTDVTESVKAEQELRESYQQYQNIIEFLPDATFVIDTNHQVIAWSKAIEELTGVKKEDIIGKGNYEYAIPFYGDRRKILIDYSIEHTPDFELYYKNIKKQGDVFLAETFVPNLRNGKGAYCWGKASLLYNSAGQLIGAIESIRDITELKLAELAIQESEKKYRDIFDNSMEGIFQSTPEGKFIRVNKAMAQLYGAETPDEMLELISNIPSQLYAEPLRRQEITDLIKREGSVNNIEFEIVNKYGKKVWVLINAKAVKDRNGKILHYEGSAKDISKRKFTEEELVKVQGMQKATLESTADGIIVTDQAGNILLTNRRFVEMWHLPEEVIRQGNVDYLIKHVYKEMVDNKTFIKNVIDLTNLKEMETLTFRFKDGRIFERFSTPLVINGEITGRVFSYRDVTEVHRMQEELYRSQKLDSLGILAGGIAHDFNNILTGILGNITLARMEIKPDTSMFSILEEAEKAAIRAKDLTQQLLTFARGGAPVKKTASIPDILHDTVQFALRGSKSICEFNIPDNLWHAEIDKGQISQVINNLIINSDEAMPQGGRINVHAENTILTDEFSSLLPGRYIKIVITDAGLGIPEEHLSRIFDPYFTTKQKGSGLGLATCYSIIKNHGGMITVDSRLGQGSTFNILVPASEERVEKEFVAQNTQRTRQGRILIMDDETMVLEVASRMLQYIGFKDIQTVTDGQNAVNTYSKAWQDGNPFTLVIMDLTVPGGMGGEEAVRSLLEIDPNAKVIVSSGYASGPVLSDYKKYGFSAVVGKPYTVNELARAVDEALNI